MALMSPKPFKFEVDLPLLRKDVAEAVAADLEPFCRHLEAVMVEADDPCEVVATFQAHNIPRGPQLLWGWPTHPQWREALRRHFGIVVLPTLAERRPSP